MNGLRAQDIRTVCMMPECRKHLSGPVDSAHVSHGVCPQCEANMLAELTRGTAEYGAYLAGQIADPRD